MHRRLCLARVPVMVFHSVRRRHLDELGDLSLEESIFDAQMASLVRAGYHTITCAALADHLEHGRALPPRPILLTFDDGYLDNFTIAAPVLARHGLCATVFVATDYLDASTTVRATSSAVDDPPQQGYLCAAELAALHASGTFEIQAHSASHARCAIAAEVVDFHRPSQPCRWLVAQRFADARATLHEGRHDARLAWGTPVRRSAWMGEARAYLHDERVDERVVAHVQAHGGVRFFERPDFARELSAIVAATPANGRFETDDERRSRLAEDLARGRARLEQILGAPVSFLAWPGGGSSPLAIEVARSLGFRATFGTDRIPPGVVPGPSAIPRTYFNQSYRGGFTRLARVWKFRGVADFESGRAGGYARVFAANRLMQVFGGKART